MVTGFANWGVVNSFCCLWPGAGVRPFTHESVWADRRPKSDVLLPFVRGGVFPVPGRGWLLSRSFGHCVPGQACLPCCFMRRRGRHGQRTCSWVGCCGLKLIQHSSTRCGALGVWGPFATLAGPVTLSWVFGGPRRVSLHELNWRSQQTHFFIDVRIVAIDMMGQSRGFALRNVV